MEGNKKMKNLDYLSSQEATRLAVQSRSLTATFSTFSLYHTLDGLISQHGTSVQMAIPGTRRGDARSQGHTGKEDLRNEN